MLPSSERRVLGERKKRKVWVYGVPTSGKTTMYDIIKKESVEMLPSSERRVLGERELLQSYLK